MTTNTIHFAGHLYRALKKEEVEQHLQLTQHEVTKMGEGEFLDLLEVVMDDLFRMEAAVKKRKELYERLRKWRLAELASAHMGKVLELGDLLMQYTEKQPAVPWAEVVKALKKAHPELKDMIDALAEEEKAKKGPTPTILKHKRKEEPKKWKELEHLPLRGSRKAQQMAELNELAEARMYEQQIRQLNTMIDQFRSMLVAEALPLAASIKVALRPNAYDLHSYNVMVDDYDALQTEIESLEAQKGTVKDDAFLEEKIADLYDEMLRLGEEITAVEKLLGPNRWSKGARTAQQLDKDIITLLNVNQGVQDAATQIMQQVGKALQDFGAQYQDLAGEVDKAPFGVIQNLEAALAKWGEYFTDFNDQAVTATRQQLVEMGENLAQKLETLQPGQVLY